MKETAAERDVEKAFLVGLCLTGDLRGHAARQNARQKSEDDLDELQRLAESAGAVIVGRMLQERERPDAATFLGEGKVRELAAEVVAQNVQVVIFDEVLTPAQNRNLEQELHCKVLDRTGLILDIFASRARSREGIVQVELAQMQYLYPRLVGMWMHFSRQQGGIGMRGPGETQLEVDRRRVRERIAFLEGKLKKIRQDRDAQRQKRKEGNLPMVALVGYTNAGKSTLLNALSGADEYVDDRLFATLDPVTRRTTLAGHWTVLLTDTVGLIQKLPHELVAAFRATFEEITEADLLLHVIDASDSRAADQQAAVVDVLRDFQCENLPRLTVYNKADRLPKDLAPAKNGDVCWVSALEGAGLEGLKERMSAMLSERWPLYRIRLSPEQGKLRAQLFREAAVIEERMDGEMMELDLRLPAAKRYLLEPCTLVEPKRRTSARS